MISVIFIPIVIYSAHHLQMDKVLFLEHHFYPLLKNLSWLPSAWTNPVPPSPLFFLSTFCLSPTQGLTILTSFHHSVTITYCVPAPIQHLMGVVASAPQSPSSPTHFGRLEAETSLSSENSSGERGKKKSSNKIFPPNVI